jgi:hypothetical protein
MIFLYTVLLLFLRAVQFLVVRRAARLERKFVRTARTADQLLQQSAIRGGNSNKFDPFQNARRQYELGRVVQNRDRIEARYDVWERFAERITATVKWLRDWKGKTLPYTFGVLDVSFVFYLIDTLGVGEYVSPRHLGQLLSSFWGN